MSLLLKKKKGLFLISSLTLCFNQTSPGLQCAEGAERVFLGGERMQGAPKNWIPVRSTVVTLMTEE